MSHNLLNKFDQPLRVDLGASRRLLLVGGTLHGAALAFCVWAPLPPLPTITVSVLLVIHFLYVYCFHIDPCHPLAIESLSWDATRGWRIGRRQGGWQTATVVSPAFVSHHLVAVRFRTGALCTRRVVLVSDRLDRDEFRRIRVRLLQSANGDRNRTQIPGAK